MEPLSKRVELTLKTANGNRASKSKIGDICKLHVGDVISGRIRRIESYGLFITIDDTNMVIMLVIFFANNYANNLQLLFCMTCLCR